MLIYLGKAEPVIIDEKKALHSVSKTYPWPSIIRISRFIKVPYKKVILTRKNILRRDGYKCAYCGRSDIPLTVDHIIPKARGGDDSWENMICACTRCNNVKGDRTPDEANMKLLFKPFKPSHIMFIKNVVGRLDERWNPIFICLKSLLLSTLLLFPPIKKSFLAMADKRILSGMRPTGKLHIGHYVGALENWVNFNTNIRVII